MFIQYFLKGISGLQPEDALTILTETGIECNWLKKISGIDTRRLADKLTERNLDWHLNHYEDVDPLTGYEFYRSTPFISTTAGTVERDVFHQRNLVFPPFLTALQFATRNFTIDGWIFYGYLFTLGKKAVELVEFAEEVRDLLIYTDYLQYYREGEVVAKIHIPVIRLERCEMYEAVSALDDLDRAKRPLPVQVHYNPRYLEAERYSNLRGMIGS